MTLSVLLKDSLIHSFVDSLRGKNKTKKKTGSLYLEVSHHDESGSADPTCGQTRRVEDAVLVLLDDVGVTEQHDHHHYTRGETVGQLSPVHLQVFAGNIKGRKMGIFSPVLEKRNNQVVYQAPR